MHATAVTAHQLPTKEQADGRHHSLHGRPAVRAGVCLGGTCACAGGMARPTRQLPQGVKSDIRSSGCMIPRRHASARREAGRKAMHRQGECGSGGGGQAASGGACVRDRGTHWAPTAAHAFLCRVGGRQPAREAVHNPVHLGRSGRARGALVLRVSLDPPASDRITVQAGVSAPGGRRPVDTSAPAPEGMYRLEELAEALCKQRSGGLRPGRERASMHGRSAAASRQRSCRRPQVHPSRARFQPTPLHLASA